LFYFVFLRENRKEQEWILSAVQMVISPCPGAGELIALTIYKVASVTHMLETGLQMRNKQQK